MTDEEKEKKGFTEKSVQNKQSQEQSSKQTTDSQETRETGGQTTTTTKSYQRPVNYAEFEYKPDMTLANIFKKTEPVRRVSEEERMNRRAKYAAFSDLARALGQLGGGGYAPTQGFVPNPEIRKAVDREDQLRNWYNDQLDAYRQNEANMSVTDYMNQKKAHQELNKPNEVTTQTTSIDKTTTKEGESKELGNKQGTEKVVTEELNLEDQAKLGIGGNGHPDDDYLTTAYTQDGRQVPLTESQGRAIAARVSSLLEDSLFLESAELSIEQIGEIKNKISTIKNAIEGSGDSKDAVKQFVHEYYQLFEPQIDYIKPHSESGYETPVEDEASKHVNLFM